MMMQVVGVTDSTCSWCVNLHTTDYIATDTQGDVVKYLVCHDCAHEFAECKEC
jgi:hypothetical protein